MTGIFKANNPANTIVLLFYGIVLKLPIFLHPNKPTPQLIDGFLYKSFLLWLQPYGNTFPIIYSLITFALLFAQAIYFNKLVNDLKLFPKANHLTAMSYLLITSLFAEWNMLSAPLIICTLLIWVWAKLSSINNIESPKTLLFNIGIFIGIATFFYFPSIAFVVLIIFGLAIIRPFNFSEWIISVLGILTPYYFIFILAFLTDKLKSYKLPGVAITSPKFNQTYWAYIAIVIILIISLIGFIFLQQNFRRQFIQTRKSWNLIFLYAIVAVFIPFINATHTFEYWILCAVPISVLMAATFFYLKNKKISLTIHWVLICFVIIISYYVKQF